MYRTLVLCSMLLAGSGGLLAQAVPQEPTPQQIQQYVQDLGSPDIATRQAAVDQLTALGSKALPTLENALVRSKDPEVRWNASWLVREIRSDTASRGGLREEPAGSLREQLLGGSFPGTQDELRRRLGLDDWSHRFGFFFDDLEDLDDLFSSLRERALRLPRGQEGMSSSGVSILRDADGSVRVEVREQTPDGNAEEQVYEAESLAAFKEQYPEVIEKYGLQLEGDGTFRFDFRDDPLQRLWGRDPLLGPGDDDHGWPGLDSFLRPARTSARPERLGIYVEPVDEALQKELQLQPGEHLVVRKVERGLGQQLGLQDGDVLLELNGVTLTSAGEVRKALRAAPDGGELNLKIVRPGHGEITLKGSMPEPEQRQGRSRWY